MYIQSLNTMNNYQDKKQKNKEENDSQISAERVNNSKISISGKQQKQRCSNCLHHSQLICYACCFEFACQKCFSSDHFMNCQRQFNKYTINLHQGGIDEVNRLSKKGKQWKPLQKCKRCQKHTQFLQYCSQCKTTYCNICSSELHSKGKFVLHSRINNLQLQQKKESAAENCEIEENIMRKSKKQNMENFQYGFKAKEKLNKMMGTPNKKGRSIAKIPFQNQENNPIQKEKMRKSHLSNGDLNALIPLINSNVSVNKPHEEGWRYCCNHGKIRNIFTQNYDLVCCDCYEEIKTSTLKLKNIDVANWIKSQNGIKQLSLSLNQIVKQLTLKNNEITLEFGRFKAQLFTQFTKKQQILLQKYRANLLSIDKWQKINKQNLSQIINRCINTLSQNISQTSLQISQKQMASSQFDKIAKLKYLLQYQQIVVMKKQFILNKDQYQFRVNQINSQYFEDMLKNFSFVRRKIQSEGQLNNQQKSLSKISQSNQLRQSRLSNSSLITDRKLKRDESLIKSNYFDLSHGHNLMKRSMSKEIKQDLIKDISQRVLFPKNVGAKSDKKQKIIKNSDIKHMRNSQYFFENDSDNKAKVQSSMKKQNLDLSEHGFKEIKYINLENFITEKLQKSMDCQIKNLLQNPSPALTDDRQNSYANQLHISTELTDDGDSRQKLTALSDTRMTYSINIGLNNPSKFIPQNTSTTNSVNSSMMINKNKRKSDYMEMRDRLRKPTAIHKIGK